MSVIDSNICENSGMAMNAAAAAPPSPTLPDSDWPETASFVVFGPVIFLHILSPRNVLTWCPQTSS